MKVLMPRTLAEACDMMTDGFPVPFAGGTDLLVHWPIRLDAHDKTYLDLSGVRELRPLRWTDSALELGALTTYWDVIRDARAAAEFPLLVAAARQVGAVQIQSRGTWAGNIANASPAADGVPALMAHDAVVVMTARDGTQEVPLSEYYTGYKKMRRRSDQLITGIRIPRRPHDVAIFEKVGPRRAQAITKVGVAIAHSASGWRIVANSVAPTVRRCPSFERMIESGAPVRGPDDLMPAIRTDVSPIDDIRSTAQYRERVMARVIYHALRGVCRSFGA